MGKVIRIICAALSLCLLCSCGENKNAVRKEEPEINTDRETEITTESETYDIETSLIPEPIAEAISAKEFSKKKICHSYGVAKNGKANEISVNAQKFFESRKFKAFCLDTKSDGKVLYLTFDCGYENGNTEKILDVLKEKGVNAAFFCTLPQIKENPQLIRRMIDEGHIVGNHSATHPSFAEISQTEMSDEILLTDKYLRENFNYSEPYFRFPKGEYTEEALNRVNSLGYTCVFWSLAYADWDTNNQKGAGYAYEKVISRLHPGAVILLHSVSSDNAEALSGIIDKARAEGYEFRSLRDYKI